MNKFFFLSALVLSSSAFAVEQNSKKVTGFDNLFQTQATDCTFVSETGADGILAVGINSVSIDTANTLVRLPLSALPLADGFETTDPRGFVVTYQRGTLKAVRTNGSGEGIGSEETVVMELQADPNLSRAASATVSKREGVFKSHIEAEISCTF